LVGNDVFIVVPTVCNLCVGWGGVAWGLGIGLVSVCISVSLFGYRIILPWIQREHPETLSWRGEWRGPQCLDVSFLILAGAGEGRSAGGQGELSHKCVANEMPESSGSNQSVHKYRQSIVSGSVKIHSSKSLASNLPDLYIVLSVSNCPPYRHDQIVNSACKYH
jgi:hypothetical protein